MDPSWSAYSDTHLRFPGAGLTIDLRRPLSPLATRTLAGMGLLRPFAVITACNPLGARLGAESNRRLGSVLTVLVRDRYPDARPADGGSPDGAHVEPGWAIPAPLEEARVLAARFLQNALFWFDGARFSIVPVQGEGPPLILPAES